MTAAARKTDDRNLSIHPRVVAGHTVFSKVNTSRAPNPERRLRVIASIQEHLSRHPNDRVRAAYLAKLEAALRTA